VAHSVAWSRVPQTKAVAGAAQKPVVVWILVVRLDQIVIDILDAELGAHAIQTHCLQFQHHERTRGVLSQRLIDTQPNFIRASCGRAGGERKSTAGLGSTASSCTASNAQRLAPGTQWFMPPSRCCDTRSLKSFVHPMDPPGQSPTKGIDFGDNDGSGWIGFQRCCIGGEPSNIRIERTVFTHLSRFDSNGGVQSIKPRVQRRQSCKDFLRLLAFFVVRRSLGWVHAGTR